MAETLMVLGAVMLYLAISLVALYLTYREQQLNGISSPVFRMIGFALCAIWPVTFVILSSTRLVLRA